IDQHDSVRFALPNFFESSSKLFSKITILPEHLPQAEHGCVADPIFELPAGDLLHLRTAAPEELQFGIQFAQGTHQGGAVVVSDFFTGGEVNLTCFVVAAVWAATSGIIQATRLPIQ